VFCLCDSVLDKFLQLSDFLDFIIIITIVIALTEDDDADVKMDSGLPSKCTHLFQTN
jgi:hypothetical protein